MPCRHLLPGLLDAGFDVFNFSQEMDIAVVKAVLGGCVALMGNLATLDLGVRGTPEQVAHAARACLDRTASGGGMVLSFGGDVSPSTRPENIDALLHAARTWRNDADK